MNDERLVKRTPSDGGQVEPRYFVVPYDPTGIMMSSRKFREHLTLDEAKALQDDATKQGAMLLIYEERRDRPKPEP
jgi:hypothetical protein